MLRFILLPLLILNTLFALEETFDVNLSVQQKLIYISQKEKPTTYYQNQLIELQYDSIIVEDFTTIETNFQNYWGIDILTQDPQWTLEDNNRYHLSIFGKILKENVKLPNIEITITTENNTTDSETFIGEKIKAYKIAENKNYIGIIAHDLFILNHTIEKFDDKENILTIEMNGTLANFEDINISFASKQGFDKLENNFPASNMFYYAVIPNHIKEFNILTFNPRSGNFIKKEIILDFTNFGQKISTQIDLNPNKKKFPYLEVIVITLLVVFVLILLIKTKHWIFLVVLGIIISGSSWILLKETKVTIYTGSSVFLLPIENSTLFYKTDREMEVTKLKENKTHIKVLLPDENVGWIRREDVRNY